MQMIEDHDAAEMFFFFLERNCKPKGFFEKKKKSITRWSNQLLLTFFKSRLKYLCVRSGGFAADGFAYNLFTLSKDCMLPKSQRLHHCDFFIHSKKRFSKYAAMLTPWHFKLA